MAPAEAIDIGQEKNAEAARRASAKRSSRLDEEAAEIPLEETGLLALDWLNGRRTPDADQALKGAIVGLSLGTTAPGFPRPGGGHGFRLEGHRRTVPRAGRGDQARDRPGRHREEVALVMQVTADVLSMPIKVAASDQTCALGAAMFGAVVAGCYRTILEAQDAMNCGFSRTYRPDPGNAARYREIYRTYLDLGDKLGDILRGL